MTSRSLKKTVSRDRSSPSSTTIRTGCGGSSCAGCTAVGSVGRVAVGQEQQIAGRLGAVADGVGSEVSQAAGHRPPDEGREPAEYGHHRQDPADE